MHRILRKGLCSAPKLKQSDHNEHWNLRNRERDSVTVTRHCFIKSPTRLIAGYTSTMSIVAYSEDVVPTAEFTAFVHAAREKAKQG